MMAETQSYQNAGLDSATNQWDLTSPLQNLVVPVCKMKEQEGLQGP